MNISEAISWKKTLTGRHAELVQLRNANATTTRYRIPGQPDEVKEPVYDAKALDKRITLIAREIRLVDESIKRVNAATQVDIQRNEDVLGELE